MYLKFDDKIKVSVAQLKTIAAILGIDDVNDLKWFYNVHYETCKYEIECVIDNAMDQESARKFKADNEDTIERWTDDLYYRADYQWDCLYEKAEEIVDLELDEIDLEDID